MILMKMIIVSLHTIMLALFVFSQEQSETVFSVIIELASLPDEIWTSEVVPLGRLPDFAGILLDFGTNSGAEFG